MKPPIVLRKQSLPESKSDLKYKKELTQWANAVNSSVYTSHGRKVSVIENPAFTAKSEKGMPRPNVPRYVYKVSGGKQSDATYYNSDDVLADLHGYPNLNESYYDELIKAADKVDKIKKKQRINRGKKAVKNILSKIGNSSISGASSLIAKAKDMITNLFKNFEKPKRYFKK